MDKFLEAFPVWAVAIEDKKTLVIEYLSLKNKSGAEFIPVFTTYDRAETFVKKNKLFVGLAAFDTLQNFIGFLESLKKKKFTHVGFDPRHGGEVDLFSIDEAIEAARKKGGESSNGKHNGKSA